MRVRTGLDGFLRIQFFDLKRQHHCCRTKKRFFMNKNDLAMWTVKDIEKLIYNYRSAKHCTRMCLSNKKTKSTWKVDSQGMNDICTSNKRASTVYTLYSTKDHLRLISNLPINGVHCSTYLFILLIIWFPFKFVSSFSKKKKKFVFKREKRKVHISLISSINIVEITIC